MFRSIAGRITFSLIAGIIVTVVAVGFAVLWMAREQNNQAEEASKTMVLGGIASMEDHVRQFANDYAWWEAGYDAYMAGDREWVDVNFGSGITDTHISDILVIISPDGDLPYSWAIDNDHGRPDEIFTPHVRQRLKELLAGVPVVNEAARSGYFRVGDGILLAAVARIAPVSRASEVDAETLPLLVQGIYLDQRRLQELGAQFLLNDVHLQIGRPTAEVVAGGYPVITDLDGNQVGAFVWTPIDPGFDVLQRVAPPVSAALVIFCAVAVGAAYRTRRLALALTTSEREALTAARTDSMTGLMNRAGFGELLDSERSEDACRGGDLAVIYIDVNGFKTVNDSIGHHGGDELVRALSERIGAVLPAAAHFARIGGDEFAVALLDGAVDGRAGILAREISQAIDRPFAIYGFEFHVTAAIGLAASGESGLTPHEILRRADLAMYQAKTGAERDPVAYHTSMETGALEKKQIEAGLRRAIDEGELKVFYQPIVRAADRSVVGLEALVRWTSPEFGPVSPALFIPVAEETGIIHDIGRFVVNRACLDLHRWPDLHMAVNVSPVQLRDPGFAEEIRDIVVGHGHEPSRFELELTEGILVTNPTIAERKLAALKAFGFRLALDDFGTGFSSIGYLRQFPFDVLKIDRSFVRDIGANPQANALMQSLVSLGDSLNLSVIAEGIETEEQLKLLRLIQCELIQGFLISKPVAAEEVAKLTAGGTAPRGVGHVELAASA
jgi:diguanylate cyclase (GGDEF)-like protein